MYRNLKVFFISKRDTSQISEVIHKSWPENIIPKIKNLKVFEIEEGKRLLQFEDFTAVQINQNIILPFLSKLEILKYFPFVKVDMGAVKFICNGAKVMRPGIVEFGVFKKGDIVTVKDQTHAKTLAVGIALEDSETAFSKTNGLVIDNLHHISDRFWEANKEIGL